MDINSKKKKLAPPDRRLEHFSDYVSKKGLDSFINKIMNNIVDDNHNIIKVKLNNNKNLRFYVYDNGDIYMNFVGVTDVVNILIYKPIWIYYNVDYIIIECLESIIKSTPGNYTICIFETYLKYLSYINKYQYSKKFGSKYLLSVNEFIDKLISSANKKGLTNQYKEILVRYTDLG